jgi:hypothetical protein
MAKHSQMRSLWLPAFLALLVALTSHAGKPAPAPVPKAESYLLVPEPKAMRSSASKVLANARSTVFSPAHATGGALKIYTAAEFAKLGLGWETFQERAQAAAERLLAARTPELIKDKDGRVQYAVYRGDEEVIACLLLAPSLAHVFKKVFGEEVWLVCPDRHSLYIFPPKSEDMADFADDLRQRYDDAAFAASDEIFLRKNDAPLQAIGSLPK